jgi:hypothetical protein
MSGSVPLFDDQANASGLGTPAILRGTVSTYNIAGVVAGTGQSLPVRQNNATQIQAAINYASSNSKFFEVYPQTIEFDSAAGLTIPAGRPFVWRGSQYGSVISQFHANAPILTVGNTTTAINGLDFYGASLQYGVSQTGNTRAQALVLGALTMGRLGGVNLVNLTNPAYDSIYIPVSSLGNWSMEYDNIIAQGAQHSFLNCPSGGTGNIWDNVYFSNGFSGTYNPLSSDVVLISGTTNDWTFRRLNIEWLAAYRVFNLPNEVGIAFDELHIEGVQMGVPGNSFSPVIFGTATASVDIRVLDLVDVLVQSAHMSGTAALVQDYVAGASTFRISTLNWWNNAPGQINSPFMFYIQAASGVDDTICLSIDKAYIRDQTGTNIFNGHLTFDANMPTSSFNAPNKFGRYDYGVGGSKVQRAQIPVSATYTHYSQHDWATLTVPASITSFTITLAATVGPTGNRAAPTGNVVRTRRQSGTAAGTLTVKDDAGTTLTTNTTSGADLYYVFNGTHYVTFTPEPG